jgi:hypothetical protein
MSEIDPWALPRGGPKDAAAGIPGTAPRPRMIMAAPLNKTLPILVMVLGVFYVAVSLVEIFVLNNEVSLANSIISANGATQDQVSQAQSDDNTISTVSGIALVVFLGTLAAIIVWQRSLNRTLGSVGASRAVFSRAGYVYFRGAWLISVLLSVFLSTIGNDNENTLQDVINHDHEVMLYYGARAVVGVVLLFFAFRLKKISEEGVARLGGAYA